jgi:hypothetical protein
MAFPTARKSALQRSIKDVQTLLAKQQAKRDPLDDAPALERDLAKVCVQQRAASGLAAVPLATYRHMLEAAVFFDMLEVLGGARSCLQRVVQQCSSGG